MNKNIILPVLIAFFFQFQEHKVLEIKGYSAKFPDQNATKILRAQVNELAQNNPTIIYINGQTNKKQIALTFDDASNIHKVNQIINILDQYGLKAAFFCIGNDIEKTPQIARNIDNNGHLVLNHSYSHTKYTELSIEAIEIDFLRAEKVFLQAIGKRTKLIRPPYGAINQDITNTLKNKGYSIAYWSLDSFDWLETINNIQQNIIKNVRNDEIILFHCKTSTIRSLPQIIENLQQRGFKIVRLDELIQKKAYRRKSYFIKSTISRKFSFDN